MEDKIAYIKKLNEICLKNAIATPYGKYKKAKTKNLCDCSIGFNYDSHQIIRCKNPAQYLWYHKKNWEKEELYDTLGAFVCEECLQKLTAPR